MMGRSARSSMALIARTLFALMVWCMCGLGDAKRPPVRKLDTKGLTTIAESETPVRCTQ